MNESQDDPITFPICAPTASTIFPTNEPASTWFLGAALTEELATSALATTASTTLRVSSEWTGFSTPMIYLTACIGIPSKCLTTSIQSQDYAAG